MCGFVHTVPSIEIKIVGSNERRQVRTKVDKFKKLESVLEDCSQTKVK